MLVKAHRNWRHSSRATVVSILACCFPKEVNPLSLTSRRGPYGSCFATMEDATPDAKRRRKLVCGSLACPRWVKPVRCRTFLSRSRSSNQEPSSEDAVAIQSESEQVQTEKKRPRPCNSYLKVVLDDDTMDRLHGVALALQKNLENMANTSENTTLNREAPVGAQALNLYEDLKLKVDGALSTESQAGATIKESRMPSSEPSGIREEESDDHAPLQIEAMGVNIDSLIPIDETTPPTNLSATKEEGAERNSSVCGRQRHIKFKPRSRASLHSTLFFGGEVLCSLPPSELIEWHARVKERLARSGYVLKSTKESTIYEEDNGNDSNDQTFQEEFDPDDYWFRIKELSLFPPRRNNLIVAILEASPAWQALHDDIRDIAVNSISQGLQSVTKRSKAQWVPHVTLGNLSRGKKAELQALQTMLVECSSLRYKHLATGAASGGDRHTPTTVDPVDFDNSDKVQAIHVSMGGPIPEQVALDWDFSKR